MGGKPGKKPLTPAEARAKAARKIRKARQEYRQRFEEFHDKWRRQELKERAGKAKTMKARKAILAKRDKLLTITPEIKSFAQGFGKSERGVRAMFDRLSERVKLVKAKPYFAEFMYGKQTAHDILVSGKVPVMYYKRKPLWGCKSLCVLTMALLKAKGIKAKHIRTANNLGAPHSVIYFKLGNRAYLVDLFESGKTSFVNQRMAQIGQGLRVEIMRLRGQGRWREQPLEKKFRYSDYAKEFEKGKIEKGIALKKKPGK